jgi:hypothetical protein
MAERYGGRYSPGASGRGRGKAPMADARGPRRMAFRTNMLFVLPFVFAFAAFGLEAVGMLEMLVAFGLMMLSAWLTREGLAAEDVYNARKIARPPAIPRKLFGSALMGGGLFLAGAAQGAGLVPSLIFGGLGAVLHGASFGLDPLRSKGVEQHGEFQSDRVAKVVDEAETYLTEMRESIAPLGDRTLTARVDSFLATARKLCRSVENDPRALTGARRYLGVYLLGARDATRKFVDLTRSRKDPEARADYETLLDDLEKTFAARTEQMLLDDRSDLDIEIDVLRERLEREGVRAE